jgi:U3 small nucleolar ribonucleoprotein component
MLTISKEQEAAAAENLWEFQRKKNAKHASGINDPFLPLQTFNLKFIILIAAD